MSLLSDFMASGGKPRLITRITSGTGTHIPTVDMARCLVRIQAGGASGGSSSDSIGGGGGGAGAMVEVFLRVPIAGYGYIIGAGGAASGAAASGNNGALSRFGSFTAEPGLFGMARAITPNYTASRGGGLGNLAGFVNASGTNMFSFGQVSGVAGGAGGGTYNVKGCAPGFPVSLDSTYGWTQIYNGVSTTTGGLGGGGGDSFFGVGGDGATTNGGAGSPATGYGAGGGGCAGNAASGAGAGGLIEIWDFGA